MAEFQEVIKQYNRMCDGHKQCNYCQINVNRGIFVCSRWLIENPTKGEEIIMKWAKENPVKTNKDKFKEVFGFDPYTVDLFETIWFEKEYKEPKDE